MGSDEVTEAVTVTIDDESDEGTDINVVVNTMAGTNSFQVNNVKGKLCAVIISTPEDISVKIESTLGYALYDNIQFLRGVQYVVPHASISDAESHRKNFQGEPFYLNEPLVLSVTGPKNVDVNFIIRLG